MQQGLLSLATLSTVDQDGAGFVEFAPSPGLTVFPSVSASRVQAQHTLPDLLQDLDLDLEAEVL